MKFIVDIGFPLEPFITVCPLGHSREKIGELLGAVEPGLSTSPTAVQGEAP